MSIRDFIERKKQEFFVAKDSDKLQLQKEYLAKEREKLVSQRTDLEQVRKLQDDVRRERSAVKNLQGNDIMSKVRGGFKNLSENVKRFDGVEKKQQGNSPFFSAGPSGIHHLNDSPMRGDGPFSTGGPAERLPPVNKEKTKTITIKLRE